MKKLFITILIAFIASSLIANKPPHNMTPEERKAAFMRIMGGFIKDDRNLKGKVVIVNTQNLAKEEWLKSAANTFANDVQINVDVVQGKFDFPNPILLGEATLFVVNDPSLPISLCAPESKWAVINVAPLKTDADPFFRSRVERSIVRGIVPLLCGADSQYPLCLMGAVHKPEDLDRFINARLPIDVIARMKQNFKALGLGSWTMSTYRKACQQGWAPAPTNDIQKAIWDKVHAMPTAPIKIKPETKKVRE